MSLVLPTCVGKQLERAKGIEPSSAAWKDSTGSFSDARRTMDRDDYAIEAEIRSWPPNTIATITGTVIGDLNLEVLYGPPHQSRPGQPRRPDPYNIGRVEDQFDALLRLP